MSLIWTNRFPGAQLTLASMSVVGTTPGPTTASGIFAVLAEMTITMTVDSGRVSVVFNGSFRSTDNDEVEVALFDNGVLVTGTTQAADYVDSDGALDPNGSFGGVMATSAVIDYASSASHTYTVQWRAPGGTARAKTTYRKLTVTELPRTALL